MNRRGLCLVLLGTSLGACATVEPWQRGVLAKPEMALQPAPLLGELRDHVFVSREGASGGSGAEGGGCGCN